ncbi:hypothetical protein GCM10023264_11260 [Sphingomonas daechungensis]
MSKRLFPPFALCVALLATPCFSQSQTTADAESKPVQTVPASNTNVGPKDEKICENITPIGSRLATKRFCGTRAEWEDRKRQDRDFTEQVQKGRHCQSQGGAQC